MSACVRQQRNTLPTMPNTMATLDALLLGQVPRRRQLTKEVIFPSKMYGEWQRVKYSVSGRNKQFVAMPVTQAKQLTISFHRTLNDFVRTSQNNKTHRASVTWITDGEWHDNERITVNSETQFSREVRMNNHYCSETVQLAGNYLHLIGYNGRFWYRALFRKNFYPMKTIPEIFEI